MYANISNPMDYKAAFYIRLSKEDDSEKESESVTNQRSLLNDFAQKHRLNVIDTYVDDGYSGTSFDRPDFIRLIADIEARRINMVITKDMSRLGRDYIMTGHYLEKFFPENNVRYLSVLDGIDTGIESSLNDITPFKAIMNDLYAKDISKKISSVKRNKQKKGLFIGGKAPYGYQLSSEQKNVIIIDTNAADIVKQVFGLAIAGKSCREIAVILNEEGIPTPSVYANLNVSKKGPYSGKWSSERITFMLKNQVYIGNMVQGRIKKINYKSKKCQKLPPEQWTIVENTHEPIVDHETFDKVQMLIDSRKKTRSRTYDYLLKGMIFCHECGYPLGVMNRPLAQNRFALYFVCRTYQRFTSYQKCTCHCVKVESVTNAVMEKINQIFRQYINRNTLADIAKQALRDLKIDRDNTKKIYGLKAQIENLTIKLDKMYTDKLSGILDDNDFQRIYLRIKEERSKLQEKIKKMESSQKPGDSEESLTEELVGKFLNANDYNRELIVSLVERIEMTEKKEIRIFFRFKQLEALSHL